MAINASTRNWEGYIEYFRILEHQKVCFLFNSSIKKNLHFEKVL